MPNKQSLCIVAHEWVWAISVEIKVIDYDGSCIDVSTFATLAALRAFRKPEVTVTSGISSSSFSKNGNGEIAKAGIGMNVADIEETEDMDAQNGVILTIHRATEREPLPLALHQVPLTITYGILQTSPVTASSASASGGSSRGGCIFVADCTRVEELAMDGSIAYTINAHDELCAITKPGHVSVTPADVLLGVQLAVTRAKYLHSVLERALIALQLKMEKQVEAQTVLLQLHNQQLQKQMQTQMQIQTADDTGTKNISGGGGLSKNDPLLSWQLLHRPAMLPSAALE